MNNKNNSEELRRKAESVADVFDNGVNEIIKKPEFAEYFYEITPQGRERVREEMIGFVTHALPILLRMNGHLHDTEEVGTFVERFVDRAGGLDDSLFERLEEYRSLDRQRGDPLSSATQIHFAKRLSTVLLGRESEDGDVLLGLSDLGMLFLINFITPTLAEAFYNQPHQEKKK
jgi:hypothetical protein